MKRDGERDPERAEAHAPSMSSSPLRPRVVSWLYLLALLPTITEWVEAGRLPTGLRDLITDVVMTAVVFVGVAIIVREFERIAAETQLRIAAVEQLRHADRLSTVGRLAAGLAHELGTPLNVVAGRAKTIAVGEVAEEGARDAARIILETTQRMTQLVRELLDFARRRPASPARVDLQEVARKTQQLLEPTARKKRIALGLEVADSGTAFLDVLQIQQALTNLVMNAIQAVAPGGHVRIVVARQRATAPVDQGGRTAEYVCLAVKDDGPGIAPLDRPQIFDPFFTTKDVGEGTGLGLAVAHGLVRENGGWISVESEVGRGACFSIFLPPSDPLESERS